MKEITLDNANLHSSVLSDENLNPS